MSKSLRSVEVKSQDSSATHFHLLSSRSWLSSGHMQSITKARPSLQLGLKVSLLVAFLTGRFAQSVEYAFKCCAVFHSLLLEFTLISILVTVIMIKGNSSVLQPFKVMQPEQAVREAASIHSFGIYVKSIVYIYNHNCATGQLRSALKSH